TRRIAADRHQDDEEAKAVRRFPRWGRGFGQEDEIAVRGAAWSSRRSGSWSRCAGKAHPGNPVFARHLLKLRRGVFRDWVEDDHRDDPVRVLSGNVEQV